MITSQTDSERGTKRKTTKRRPLGAKPKKTKGEKVLEKIVLGGDEEIINNLAEISPKKVNMDFRRKITHLLIISITVTD